MRYAFIVLVRSNMNKQQTLKWLREQITQEIKYRDSIDGQVTIYFALGLIDGLIKNE